MVAKEILSPYGFINTSKVYPKIQQCYRCKNIYIDTTIGNPIIKHGVHAQQISLYCPIDTGI